MEFGGMVGLLAGASSESVFSSSMESSDAELSSQRATEAEETEEHGMRCLKLARTELRMMPEPVKMAPFFTPTCLFPEGGEQMLSFSSPSKQGALMLTLDGTLPCYHHLSTSTPSSSHMRNAGMHAGGGSREHKHGVLAMANGGPFTPSQWLEFERQALIYKHIVANIAIPPNLLVSVRSGFGFPPFSAGYFGSMGWRQVGKEDPEPGRCRRTDGKKWRCSRDVVADQKYCERHMNRGRHRSRKHVEGHIDHAAKVIPTTAPTKSASPAPREGGASGRLTNSLHQTECLQTNGCYPSQLDRMEMNSERVNERTQDFGSLSLPCSLNSRNSSKLFPLSQEQNPFEEESCGFQHRFILMDSPFKPPSSSSDSIQCSDDELSRNQFVSWPTEEMQYDRTQLSISMPKSCSNLVPASQESNAINVVRDGVPKEASQYQKGRMVISPWECSMAGPLGEVLNNARHTAADEQCKNLFSSSINFLADGCDLNNWLESSPTHVLKLMAACVMIFSVQLCCASRLSLHSLCFLPQTATTNISIEKQNELK